MIFNFLCESARMDCVNQCSKDQEIAFGAKKMLIHNANYWCFYTQMGLF